MNGDDLRQFLTPLLGGFGPAAVLGWWLAFRKDRREQAADGRQEEASEVNIVSLLLENQGTMQDQIQILTDRWVGAQSDAALARSEAATARSEAALARADAASATREVTLLRSTLSRVVAHFRPLVEWLDAGAAPPPPPIPHDVRDLLDSAEG